MARGHPSRQEFGILFRDILLQDDVRGVMFFSYKGEMVHKEFVDPPRKEPEAEHWWPYFIDSMDGVQEADLVFEKGRLYIRRTKYGYLLVLMGLFAPVTMVRLKCDILLPALDGSSGRERRRKFFRKKK
jgi:hypothetical protein